MRTACILLVTLTACSGGPPDEQPTTPVPPTPPVVDADGDGHPEGDDCDDQDPAVHPRAAELCNGVDDDCDGTADDGVEFRDHHPDHDGDGFGDADAPAVNACEAPQDTVPNGDDCDDADPAIHPDAAEICNDLDDDCSGVADDGLPFEAHYPDADGDGHGDAAALPVSACVPPPDTVLLGDDCDDANDAVHPGATETCNGVDDDCANGVDDGVTTAFSVDLDQDGYGAMVDACADPDGAGAELPGDCDDGSPTVYPGAPDDCDGIDQDCSGQAEHRVPEDFTQPSDAIAAAAPGDFVCIGAGTYGPAVIDRDLQLVGVGPADVAIDGGGLARALDIAVGVGSVDVRGVTLQHGEASVGAGLRVAEPTAVVTLTDVVVRDNTCSAASCAGAGISFTGHLTLDGVVVEANHAVLPGDGNLTGVGIHGSQGTLDMSACEVARNTGTSQGSIWIEGGGLFLEEVDTVIRDSAIRENALTGGQTRAHALGAYGETNLLLERVRIEGNTAYGDTWPYPAKGAVQLGLDAQIRNTLIVGNHVDAESGSILGNVLTTFGDKTIEITHSTIAHNTAGALEPWGALLDGNNATVTWSHVVVSDNAGGSLVYSSGTTDFDHTLVESSGLPPQSFAAGTGNQVEVDPLFVDAPNGDYHLAPGSPAIDAGDGALSDPDGSPADLGAYGGPDAG